VIIVACSLLVAAWSQWLNSFDDKPDVLFQRAGSIATIFAVIAEANILNIKRTFEYDGFGSVGSVSIESKYRKLHYFYESVLLVLIMISTLVWGYGDIAYREWII
jgi:hypothetical protein